MPDPSNYIIQGQLPFQQSNQAGMFNGDLAGSYQSAYNTALGQNQANYNNILSGYQQTMANQVGSQNAISRGYGDLSNTVQAGIRGIDQSQRQAISDQYAQQSGSAQQDLINRGLGNSTVLSSVNRGLALDKSKADVALSNQTAQLQAGYQSQIGQAGLNYGNQANMQNTALAGAQLGFQNSVAAMYPNAQQYSQLAMQQGQINQANLDRQQAANQFAKQQQAAALNRGGGLGTLAPNRPAAPNLGPMGDGSGGGYAGTMSSVTPFGLGGAGQPGGSSVIGGGGAAGSAGGGFAGGGDQQAAMQAAQAMGGAMSAPAGPAQASSSSPQFFPLMGGSIWGPANYPSADDFGGDGGDFGS